MHTVIHHGCEFADGDEFGHLQHALLLLLTFDLFVESGRNSLPFVAAVFCRFELGPFGRKSGQSIFDLLLYLFFADFDLCNRLGSLLALLLNSVFSVLNRTGRIVRFADVFFDSGLILLLRYIDLVLGDSFPFFPLAVSIIALLLFE